VSKIKILPENLANQIAAGEVIERPASVVKEFVENAIDAEAHNIFIQIEGDGSRLIRVVDDGVGMEEDDILLSLERHATSKLESSEQLSSIHTLGFRGEALPSIASVSKLSITSRRHAAELGSRAEIRFGRLLKVHDMGCPPGTAMEVKDLFGNLPARKKFLKSLQTEISHIEEIVKNYALVKHDLGFRCEIQGRTVLDVAAHGGGLERRVRQIVCRSDSEELVELNIAQGQTDIAVSGYLLAPENAGGASAALRIFVNGRAVKDRGIANAVNEGLCNFLLKGRRARGVVFVNLPAKDVDVNVHPTKQEIRFQRAQKVHAAVTEAVRQGMAGYQQRVRQEIFGLAAESSVAAPAEKEVARIVFEAAKPQKKTCREEVKIAPDSLPEGQAGLELASKEPEAPFLVCAPPEMAPFFGKAAAKTTGEIQRQATEGEKEIPALQHKSTEISDTQNEIGTLRYVGQLFNSYIICESENGFVLVDQHAAQERLIFEELSRQYKDSRIPSQVLLFPEIIELAPEDRQNLEQYGEEISRMGLEIKEFGGNSFIIQGVPASLGHLGPGKVVEGILDRYSEEGGKSGTARLEYVLAGMACKASVKAGHRLLPSEAEALLTQMREAGIFSHCPHGRPVVKSFSKDDVKKWFLRT
jgi:DNA mismatch repair protein MutL